MNKDKISIFDQLIVVSGHCMLEITLKEATGFLSSFATLIGSKVEHGVVKIPANKGSGYIQGVILESSISMMIRHYELNQAVLSRRLANPKLNERVIMSFNNVFPPEAQNRTSTRVESITRNLPSVQMGRGNIDFEMVYPSKTKFRSIQLAIESDSLIKLLGTNKDNTILKTITTSDQPLLFEELISPQIQKVASEIINASIPRTLQNFYFKIKAEELICLLFVELFKRENAPVHSLHKTDVQKIYQIRNKMLSALDKPPVLGKIAMETGMSESKFKRLFKQIFGSSIFPYYQSFRMQEAARLLKEGELNVSDVGYRLGFTNLSHFTKVFEEHNGVKPKKYASTR